MISPIEQATCCIMTVLSPSKVTSTSMSVFMGPILLAAKKPCPPQHSLQFCRMSTRLQVAAAFSPLDSTWMALPSLGSPLAAKSCAANVTRYPLGLEDKKKREGRGDERRERDGRKEGGKERKRGGREREGEKKRGERGGGKEGKRATLETAASSTQACDFDYCSAFASGMVLFQVRE